MIDVLFFDSYALFEIIKGNPDYEKYKKVNILLTKLNLFEIYYGFLKEDNKEIALTLLNRYNEFVTDFDTEIIENAAKLKLMYKKRKLSMTDCIGYTLANKFKVKFLTGDMQFKDLPNVEFVQ